MEVLGELVGLVGVDDKRGRAVDELELQFQRFARSRVEVELAGARFVGPLVPEASVCVADVALLDPPNVLSV